MSGIAPTDMRLAQEIVDSDPVLRTFASCEWDELTVDGQVWVAAIIAEARRRFAGDRADIVDVPILPIKLVDQPRRSEDPRLARANDNAGVQ